MEGMDLKLVASEVGRPHLRKAKLSVSIKREPKSFGEKRQYQGHTATTACGNTQAKTASHVHFTEPRDHNTIPLYKIPYFVGGTGLLA
jgi:hypothetical protein